MVGIQRSHIFVFKNELNFDCERIGISLLSKANDTDSFWSMLQVPLSLKRATRCPMRGTKMLLLSFQASFSDYPSVNKHRNGKSPSWIGNIHLHSWWIFQPAILDCRSLSVFFGISNKNNLESLRNKTLIRLNDLRPQGYPSTIGFSGHFCVISPCFSIHDPIIWIICRYWQQNLNKQLPKSETSCTQMCAPPSFIKKCLCFL